MRPFFTIPDPELIQESSVDPLGIQVIWVEMGQKIFSDKLTTIANDLRIFNFNLLHNHIIYRLETEYPEEFSQAKMRFRGWKTDFDAKAGLIIFLEDLVTHLFYLKYHESDNARGLGILGINKVRRLHHNQPLDAIFLEASKSKGLLTRQLSLGMQGRYKGPMMSMQFFDRALTYYPKTWDDAERSIQKWNSAYELENYALALITNLLFQARKRGGDYPKLSLQEIKTSRYWKPLQENYIHCFGGQKLAHSMREYWKDRMGLNSGAAAALLKSLDKGTSDSAFELFNKASELLKNEPSELAKIERILAIEPFLSHSEYLVRYLAQASVKKIEDEAGNIRVLRDEIQKSGQFDLTDCNNRLKKLHSVFINEKPLSEWLNGIIHYHQQVMNSRDGDAWLEIDDSGSIRHQFSLSLTSNINTVKAYLIERPWLHTYYFESLVSVYNNLN